MYSVLACWLKKPYQEVPLENLDSIAPNDNGISEIAHWKDSYYFVMERAYFSRLRKTSVRIYLVDLSSADDIKNQKMC